MNETRRDFLSTSAGIGSLGLLAAIGVTPVSGADPAVTEDDIDSMPDEFFNMNGMSMSDSTLEVETLETVDEFDDEPIQMDGIELEMTGDTVDEFNAEDATIPEPVENDALEIGRQILDGEEPTEPEVPSIVIDFLFPNLIRERIAAIPLDFFDPETSLGTLITDILSVLDALGGLRATINLLTGLLDVIRSPFSFLGGFFGPAFPILNFVAGFFD
jgi:hypothetical protein